MGIDFIGQQINIEAPDGTVEDPIIITFEMHESLVPEGETENSLQIFRNGDVAFDCTDEDGHADPDPCVSERALESDQVRFVVLTSRASRWNWGKLKDAGTDDPCVVDVDGLKPETIVELDGNLASVTVPFSTPLPSRAALLQNPGAEIRQFLRLTIKSEETGTTINFNQGKLVPSDPDAPGEYTFTLGKDLKSATVTFYNEVAGITLKTDRTYEATLSIVENKYCESQNSTTFTVTPQAQ